MLELNKDNILKSNVKTINQFKILEYLKKELNVFEFRLFLYDKNTIKVIDKNNECGYFIYKDNEIIFKEYIKEKEQEIQL